MSPALAVALVVGCGLSAAFHVGKAPAAAGMLQASLGLDLAGLGWLTGVFAVIGVVGGIPTGRLVASCGDRRVLLLGMAVCAAGAGVGTGATGPGVLLASRVVEGLGFLLVSVAGPALIQRSVDAQRRDFAFACWSCCMPLGIATALAVAPLLPTWQALWGASLGATLLLAALVGWRLRATPQARRAGRAADPAVPAGARRATQAGLLADTRRLLAASGPVALATCFACYSLMFFALFSFLPVLLTDRLAVSPATAGALSALAAAANIVGNLAAGRLLGRGARRPALIVAASLAMAASAAGIFTPWLGGAAAFALCLLFSAAGGMIPATLIASAPLVAPSAALAPLVMGLLIQGSNLGQLLGPVVVGEAVEALGWPAAAAVVGLAALLAIAAALALDLPARAPGAAAAQAGRSGRALPCR